ncbi:MAG: hypothetical protein ABW321_21125 [Polyangiales bacterium]
MARAEDVSAGSVNGYPRPGSAAGSGGWVVCALSTAAHQPSNEDRRSHIERSGKHSMNPSRNRRELLASRAKVWR